jgi:AraC-like DNA-binding protein
MEIVYERIFVSHDHSFITRKMQMNTDLHKVHSHKNFELNYITAGSGKRIVGNSIMPYAEGDLVLMGPDIPHCWDPMGTGEGVVPECIVTHFYENLISSDFFNIPELEEVENLLKSAVNGIWFRGKKTEKVGQSLRKMVNLKGLELYIELLKVFNLLLEINEKEVLALPDSRPVFTDKNQSQINKIYEYVFNNIQKGILLKDAADLVFMEPGSFCRYFKKKTNQTFMNYVKNVRIGIAAKLLAETDKQIAHICYECGYKNLANFNLYFKGIMKKTPSEYRKDFR